MPSFVVKGPQGEEYEVNAPEGATQEQAFEFFKREHSAGRLQAKKPLAPIGDRIAAGFKSGLAGAGNVADTAATLVRNVPGAVKSYVTGELPASFEENMDELNMRIKGRNMWANPDEVELGTAGSIASGFGGVPSMLLAPLTGLQTTKEFLDAGESGGRAATAGLVDTTLGTAGALIPTGKAFNTLGKAVVGGAAVNTGQGALTDAILNEIATKKELQDRYQWSDLDRRLADATTGGVFGAAFRDKPQTKKVRETPADILRKQLEAEKATTPVSKPEITPGEKAFDSIVGSQLEGWNEPITRSPAHQPQRSAMGDIVSAMEQQRMSDADAAIAQRQAALEAEVAAQRARDEMARTSAMEQNSTGYAEWVEAQRRAAEQRIPGDNRPMDFESPYLLDINKFPQVLQDAPRTPEGGIDYTVPRDQAALPLEIADFLNQDRPRTGQPDVDPIVRANELLAGSELARKRPGQQPPRKGGKQSGAIDPDLLTLGLTRLFHGGKEFKKWDPRTIGKGEGMGALGPGLYAGDNPDLAKVYTKYGTSFDIDEATGNFVTTPGVLNELAVNTKNIHDYRKENPKWQKAIENLDALGYKASTRGIQGALQEAHRWKDQASARQAMIDAGIDGMYVNLGGSLGKEIVIFNPDIIAQVSRADTPIEKIDVSPYLNKGMSRKQRGALDFGPSNPKQKLIEEATKEKLFADVPNADAVISQSLGQKDSKGGWLGPTINLESGGSMAAMKRQSPLVEGGVRIMQGWKNRAEDAIRTSVFPTEQALRRLSKQELTDLGEVFKLEMFERRAFSAKELADAGLSEKQLLAYQKQREMFRNALEAENAARVAQGKKPVTEQDFYLSSRWQGDFRVGFRDAQGKLVWYLAADSKRALDKQASQLLAQFPELTPDKMHVVKSTKRSGGDVSKIYNTMLDVLGEGDPAVAKIKAWAEGQMEIEGRQVKGQEKHFEAKANVRGFVGDRPGANPTKEALAMFQQQIQYAKNAHDWAAKQMAAQELKKVLADESLAREQPNNMAYLREYFLDNLGANESNLTRAFEDWIRETTGTSPNKIGQGIGAVKNYWITSKLALNAGFMLSNVIQAGNILPHLAMMQKEFGGNPVAALTVGIPMGVAMATGHLGKTYLPQLEGMKFYNELAKTPGLTEFHARAMKYAEDNSVIARSIYDESPIESSFSTPARVAKAAGVTITLPETFLRGVTFMTYVEQLKSSGKFKNDLDLFRVAEERTNISMGDYREGERAMIFNKMGNTGNMLNVLQTFAFNFYNQYATFGRHAVESKNPLPLMAMLATHGYMAGLMGIPGFAEADKAWEGIKSLLAEHYPETWAKVKNLSIKEAALSLPGGESITYGPLSTQSGVALTSRAAAPIPSEMIASPGAPLADIGGQAMDVAKLLMDPTSKTKQAQAALSVAPAGLQGALETGPFRDVTSVPVGDKRVYGQTKKVGDLKGMYARTPEEESLRARGLRSQKEAVTRELNWMAERKGVQAASVVRGLPNSIYRDLVDEDMDSVRDKIKLYAELSGNSFSSQQLTNQVLQRYLTPDGRMISKTMPLETVKAYKRLQDTLKELGYAE